VLKNGLLISKIDFLKMNIAKNHYYLLNIRKIL